MKISKRMKRISAAFALIVCMLAQTLSVSAHGYPASQNWDFLSRGGYSATQNKDFNRYYSDYSFSNGAGLRTALSVHNTASQTLKVSVIDRASGGAVAILFVASGNTSHTTYISEKNHRYDIYFECSAGMRFNYSIG